MSGKDGRLRTTAGRVDMTGTLAVVLAIAGVVGLSVSLHDDAQALWTTVVQEARTLHHDLHHQLAAAVRAIRSEGVAAAWALVVLSFLYGVFHAAGPGHGKVVISTYILTQGSQLRRGLVLSLVSSLCQGAVAIVAVMATVGLLGLTLRQAQGAATGLESVSYGLVALLGLTLAATRVRRILRRRAAASADDSVDTSCEAPRHRHAAAGCSHCGHAHGPSARDLDAPLSWQGLVGIVASIGLRPCTGAVLVMLVAYSLDLRWAGAGAVLAMSVGTAITVSLLAVLSVYARRIALRLAAIGADSVAGRLAVALDLVAVFGGLVLLVAGVVMLQAALGAPPPHPLW